MSVGGEIIHIGRENQSSPWFLSLRSKAVRILSRFVGVVMCYTNVTHLFDDF
jgi:hypothetical protein